MGKLNIFEVSFANMSGVYYAGNIIQGHVTVELNDSMSMRGIKIEFEGKAYVHWTEQHSTGSGKDRRTETRHYSAKEKYFEQDVRLFGIWSSGSNSSELPAGRHTFPFQFQLPLNLPSSFEGAHGHVRYTAKCKIDKPWKFDHKVKRPFTVISILDLNQVPAYSQRLQSQNEKTLCCLCCASGPITATFSIERQGWVPGEAIRLFANISNGSSRSMDKSYVDLKMITTFHATSKSRSSTTKVAKVTRPGIEPHREDSWEIEELVIPPLPPSFLVGCSIIDIKYILQLNVDPSGPSLDLEIPFEIIIGTIPLMSVVQQNPPMPPAMPSAVGFDMPPVPSGAYPPDAPNYNIPPPSYSECVTGKVDIHDDDDEYTRGDLNYAPVYTYYNWGHTPGTLPPQTEKN